MGASLYRDLCTLLKTGGCSFVREAKGSHEIWHSPITNRNVSVPKGIVNAHTANGILKDAGLPKHF